MKKQKRLPMKPRYQGRYDMLPKAQRKVLWHKIHAVEVTGWMRRFTTDEAWQVLVWFRLWLRGQAGVPRFPTRVVEKALDLALRDREGRL